MSKIKSAFHQSCIDAQRGNPFKINEEFRLYNFFKLLATNRFRWENLPDGIESRHIEDALFYNGECAFFKKDKTLMALPCGSSGNVNVYGDPLSFNVSGVGYNKILSADDMVRILSNDEAIPVNIFINYYSDLLAETEATMRANLKQQKFPYIIATTKNHELTHKNIMNKLESGEPNIFVDEELSRGNGNIGISTLKTDAPYILDKLQLFKNDTVCELLTYLGFNNTNSNKKERLLVDEVNVNNSHILMNLDIEFKNREKACKEINEKYGTNISVKKVIDELQADFFGSQNEKKEDDKSWQITQ